MHQPRLGWVLGLVALLLATPAGAEDTQSCPQGVECAAGAILFAQVERQALHPVPASSSVSADIRRVVELASALTDDRDHEALAKPSKAALSRGKKRAIPVGRLHVVAPDKTEHDIGVYDALGAMQVDGLAAFARAMEVDATTIEPRLLAMLYIVARDFDRPLHLVSNHQGDPQHTSESAVDFYVPDVSAKKLRDYCADTFAEIGLGYRPKAGLVHLDVRAQSLFWTDTARPGLTGRERLEAATDPKGTDPTLDGPHLSPAALYPTARPIKRSKVAPPPKPKPKKKKRKRKRKRRR